MSLKITKAVIKPYEINSCFSKKELNEKRLFYLSEAVTLANQHNSIYLIIKGEISEMLSISEADMKKFGNKMDEFSGAAVLIVADLNESIISNFNRLNENSKVIFFPDDCRKNITIEEILVMINSLINSKNN